MLLELDDAVAPGGRPGDTECEHHRLGAGGGESNLLRRWDQRHDQFRPLDLERVGGAVVRASRHLLAQRTDDSRVGMTQEQRTVAHGVVDQLGPVDQPLSRAARSGHVDARIVGARGVGGATGEHSTGSLRQVGVGACLHSLCHRHALRIPGIWRRRSESNRRSGFCRPVPYHLATSPLLRVAIFGIAVEWALALKNTGATASCCLHLLVRLPAR